VRVELGHRGTGTSWWDDVVLSGDARAGD
jgi:hypothetical protein